MADVKSAIFIASVPDYAKWMQPGADPSLSQFATLDSRRAILLKERATLEVDLKLLIDKQTEIGLKLQQLAARGQIWEPLNIPSRIVSMPAWDTKTKNGEVGTLKLEFLTSGDTDAPEWKGSWSQADARVQWTKGQTIKLSSVGSSDAQLELDGLYKALWRGWTLWRANADTGATVTVRASFLESYDLRFHLLLQTIADAATATRSH